MSYILFGCTGGGLINVDIGHTLLVNMQCISACNVISTLCSNTIYERYDPQSIAAKGHGILWRMVSKTRNGLWQCAWAPSELTQCRQTLCQSSTAHSELPRPWMPYLNHKITYVVRLQIRQRAETQGKHMVKTSTKSNKKSVPMTQSFFIFSDL